MSKRVYKYPTGVDIPDGAVYLSTQVEKETMIFPKTYDRVGAPIFERQVENNKLVWHYFLVEVEEEV